MPYMSISLGVGISKNANPTGFFGVPWVKMMSNGGYPGTPPMLPRGKPPRKSPAFMVRDYDAHHHGLNKAVLIGLISWG